jgi:hypothetical protein
MFHSTNGTWGSYLHKMGRDSPLIGGVLEEIPRANSHILVPGEVSAGSIELVLQYSVEGFGYLVLN